MSFFETTQADYDKKPIILIDNSGSTSGNVLENEVKVAHQISKENEFEELYLSFWNNKVRSLDNNHQAISREQLKTVLYDFKIRGEGTTQLTPMLKSVPDKWYEGKQSTDVYIITDGQIMDRGELNPEIKKLVDKNCTIYIVTVNNGRSNYVDNNCNAGGSIYQRFQHANLTGFIRRFTCYNDFHTIKSGPFIMLDNPHVPDGYAPFRNKVFKLTETNNFVNYLETLLESEYKDAPENEILKLSHELTLTLHYLLKNKSTFIKRDIINMFCELFAETSVYNQIKSNLIQEVDNHKKGKATTFQQYRNNREKVFETAQIALYQNVRDSTVNGYSSHYISLPVYDKTGKLYVIKAPTEEVIESIHISDKCYQQAGIKSGKCVVPMLPMNVVLDHNHHDQCVRQWIRTNYSKKHNINAAADIILYMFLVDALKVQLSNVNPDIKNAYQKLSYLMLDRKRFGTKTTEYKHLFNYNSPAPVIGDQNKIVELLEKCAKYSGMDIKPFTLWFGITSMVQLAEKQFGYCLDDLRGDGALSFVETTFSKKHVLETDEEISDNASDSDDSDDSDDSAEYVKPKQKYVKEKDGENDKEEIKMVDVYTISENKINDFLKAKLSEDSKNVIHQYLINDDSYGLNYEFTCFITLEETNETGGYAINPHHASKNITCKPRYVMTEETYKHFCESERVICPICYSNLTTSEFIPIPSEEEYNKILTDKSKKKIVSVNEEMYDQSHHEVANLEVLEDYTLNELDNYDFSTHSYELNVPNIQDSLGTRRMEIQTQKEFNESVFKRFPFLEKIDMKGNNCVLAGGFCRSILLKQKLKDLDFFFHGDNHFQHFRTVLNQTLVALKEQQPDCKFLMMFKPMFNVFEVVSVTDPTDFIHEDYILDNFKQYQFKSLHRFDKFSIIDPINGKIYRKKGYRTQDVTTEAKERFAELKKLEEEGKLEGMDKEEYEKRFVTVKDLESMDYSNYFEDNDATGIRMNYRVQFILSKYAEPADIFRSFDMYPCMVLFNGEKTLFTKDAQLAYKYMVNIVNEKKYSELFAHRLGKYFNYGFKIAVPELDLDKTKKKNYLSFEKDLSFKIVDTHNNVITIEHNSHIKDKLNSVVAIEKKNIQNGDALYKSSLFCSLISILRYVKINEVNYIFTRDIMLPSEENGTMKFRESEVKVDFIEKINSRIDDHDFYKENRIN
jgi:hypothetical protein